MNHSSPPRHGCDLQKIPLSLLIHETSKLFHDSMRTEFEKCGIREGYRNIIFHLAHRMRDGTPPPTQLELVKLTHLKPPTVSVTLQNMEADGLVMRKADSGDMRQMRVYLTEKGVAVDDTMRSRIDALEHKMIENLTDTEKEEVRRLLIKMRGNILSDD